jgi:pimeloyl-ACP methyl ester carboxylesterase
VLGSAPVTETAPKLHIETMGEGPTLVLAHGFSGSARNFRVQAKALKDISRVVIYDARGHARSEAPPNPEAYTLDALVGDFARAAEAGGLPVIAGGLSMGAATALEFALRYPERVRGLLLAAYPSPGAGRGLTRRSWATGFADALRDFGPEVAGARYVWGEQPRFDEKDSNFIRLGFLEHPPHALEATLRGVLAGLEDPAALAPRLATIRVPALVVVGADDKESLEPSRQLAQNIPGAEFVIVPDAGHVVNLKQPAVFNELARRFIERVRAS